MQFDDLLSRLDDESLQELLGGSALRLIMLLDPTLRSPARLQSLLVDLHSRPNLLLSSSSRATLIDALRPQEAKQLASVLGISLDGNIYTNLKSARISRDSEREKYLFSFFELPVPPVDMNEPVPTIETSTCAYGLFPHQRRAIQSLKSILVDPPHRVVLHMPTGSGKTRTTMNLIAEHLRTVEPTVVVWLAYSEELCKQAVEEFQEAWHYLGNRPISLQKFWGNFEIDLSTLRDGVLVAGLSKLYSATQQSLQTIGTIGSRSSLVIIDEAHMAVAPTYKLILDALTIPFEDHALIGLTATPGRTWADIDADEQLAKFFARKKVALEIEGYDNPVDFLVDEGYLARANFRSLFYDGGLELSQADLRRIQEALDIPDAILKRLAEDEKRNLRIVLEIEDLAKQHERILLFATTVDHSELIAAVLRARGLNAHSITAQTPPDERNRIIREYKEGTKEPSIICNYGVLTTGFDAPRTSAAVIARPTKSLVLYSQMVGRAMRGPKAGGNSSAEIITVIDQQLPGFGSFADAFLNWEDIWE